MTYREYGGKLIPRKDQQARFKMRREQDLARPTMSVPVAGRKYFGLSKNAAYAAAHRNEIPTIRIGGRLFVSVVAIERMVAEGRRDDVA